MVELSQLADGNYKLVIDYSRDGFAIHLEYIFQEAESDAEPMPNGKKFRFQIAE